MNNLSNKLAKEDTSFHITTSRPIARDALAYFCAFLTLVIMAFIGVGGFQIYHREYLIGGIFLAVAVVMCGFMWYCDVHYAWAIGGTLSYKDGVLRYDYMEVFNLIGNNKNYYEIKDITKMKKKRKGRYLDIYGEVTFKGMYRKAKTVRKCRIYESNDDVIKYIEGKTGKTVS